MQELHYFHCFHILCPVILAIMMAVTARNLVRTYRSSAGLTRRHARVTQAVRGISFDVERGCLFGLLGPNGSGKTTTIKMLITLLLPTDGRASVLGLDVVDDVKAVRRQIGYVFGGDRGLYLRLSGYDNLRYFAELYNVEPRIARHRIIELLELVDMRGHEKERVEVLSRGMRQRLHIARALLHDPEVVFLDEPTLGIDPVGARELRRTVSELVERGKTVFLTTHYMFEADELCQNIAIIQHGRLIATGAPAELKSAASHGHIVEIETLGNGTHLIDTLGQLPGVRSIVRNGRGPAETLTVKSESDVTVTNAILAHIHRSSVGRVTMRGPTLEDAYVALVADG